MACIRFIQGAMFHFQVCWMESIVCLFLTQVVFAFGFISKAVIGGAGTSCPGEESWVEGLVKVDPSPDKVIMNVGCNKGTH